MIDWYQSMNWIKRNVNEVKNSSEWPDRLIDKQEVTRIRQPASVVINAASCSTFGPFSTFRY
jgi:hypothetical protein